MSRFTRALAATTMAVAAAGGGLLIAAAGAVPASAAAQGAPHGSHKITMTAHRAHAGHGIGPHVILPCVAKAGSGIRPASCGDQTITCVITAEAPFVTTAINEVNAIAHVDCSAPVTSIAFSQSLLRNGSTAAADSFTVQGKNGTADLLGATCHTATWTNTASAFITFPPGYVITGGSEPDPPDHFIPRRHLPASRRRWRRRWRWWRRRWLWCRPRAVPGPPPGRAAPGLRSPARDRRPAAALAGPAGQPDTTPRAAGLPGRPPAAPSALA